jgi:hypothetical protein
MRIGPYTFYLRDLKPIEFRDIRYFSGTRKIFGLKSAIIQMSPLLNLIVYHKYFKGC